MRDYGAVSEHVARAMSTSISEYAPADIGIGITGVAGPDRARTNRWVWYTFRYISSPKTSCTAAQLLLEGNRDQTVRLPSTPY